MKVLPFLQAYKNECLTIFDSNCPTYFTGEERQEFEQWLSEDEQYWILKDKDQILACGGIYLQENYPRPSDFPEEVGFAWGMVHRSVHGKGIGTLLVKHRLDFLQSNYSNRPVVLRTTPKTMAFYASFGFGINAIENNGYGEGLDKITMIHDNQ